jgi:predicted phosphodiesterase
MLKRLLSVVLLALIALPTLAEDPAAFLTAPYLQNMKVDAMTIMWECQEKAEMSVVHGLDENYGTRTKAVAKASGADTFIYKATLQGLNPATAYHYQVLRGDTPVTKGRGFRTATEQPVPFSFGVWSDSQGENRGAYPEDRLEPTKSMMAHIARSDVDFAVTCGDLAEDGDSYKDVRDYFLDRVAKFLGQEKPFFIAWGNHEPNRKDIIRQFADQRSQDRRGMDPGWGSFSFNYGGCHFICIDYSTMTRDVKRWLEKDLKAAQEKNPRYTFLFVHTPPYCEMWIDGEDFLRDKMVPLLEKYGVDAVFSGHTHEYERGYKEHVHYVITGGGSWLDLDEPIVKDWDHMFVGGATNLAEFRHGLVNEYVRVDVGMDSWTGSMHAFKPDGSYIGIRDTFGSALKDTDGDGLLTGDERKMPEAPGKE